MEFAFTGSLPGFHPEKQHYMRNKESGDSFSGHVTHCMKVNKYRKHCFRPVVFLVRMVLRQPPQPYSEPLWTILGQRDPLRRALRRLLCWLHLPRHFHSLEPHSDTSWHLLRSSEVTSENPSQNPRDLLRSSPMRSPCVGHCSSLSEHLSMIWLNDAEVFFLYGKLCPSFATFRELRTVNHSHHPESKKEDLQKKNSAPSALMGDMNVLKRLAKPDLPQRFSGCHGCFHEDQGRTNPAFSKPCLFLSDTRHFRHFRRFRGSEEQSPYFQWVECKFVIFAVFVKTAPFWQGTKARFTKNTVCATPRRVAKGGHHDCFLIPSTRKGKEATHTHTQVWERRNH